MRERKGKRKKERLTYRRQIKGWNPARVHEGDKRGSVHMPADTGEKRTSALAHGRLRTRVRTGDRSDKGAAGAAGGDGNGGGELAQGALRKHLSVSI